MVPVQGRPVGPLQVVHQAHDGPLLRDLGEQREHGQGDLEPVGRGTGPKAERVPQGLRLRLREPEREPAAEDGAQELVQHRIRERRLGLGSGGAQHGHAVGPLGGEGEEGRLACAWLAAQDEPPTPAAAGGLEHAVDRSRLGAAIPQHGLSLAMEPAILAMRGVSPRPSLAGMTTNDQRKEAEEQVRQLGERWADAERRGDAEALRPLLADDFVLVGPLGFMLDKQQYLGSRLSGDLRHESFAWDDVGVRVYGEAAVAVGSQTQRSTYQERDASGRFRVTQIAVEQGGRWVIAGIHLSPIAQPG